MTETEIKTAALATAIKAAGTHREAETQELNLADAQVADILDILDDCEVVVKPGKSIRRSVRLPSRASATMHVDGKAFRVRMRNMSRRGAGFLYNNGFRLRVLSPGDIVRLDVPTQDGIAVHETTVVRSRHIDGPIYEIGVEFIGVF